LLNKQSIRIASSVCDNRSSSIDLITQIKEEMSKALTTAPILVAAPSLPKILLMYKITAALTTAFTQQLYTNGPLHASQRDNPTPHYTLKLLLLYHKIALLSLGKTLVFAIPSRDAPRPPLDLATPAPEP